MAYYDSKKNYEASRLIRENQPAIFYYYGTKKQTDSSQEELLK